MISNIRKETVSDSVSVFLGAEIPFDTGPCLFWSWSVMNLRLYLSGLVLFSALSVAGFWGMQPEGHQLDWGHLCPSVP